MVPESVRWLLANNKTDEAKQIILLASKENQRPVPGHYLDHVARKSLEVEKVAESTSMLDVLKNSKILLRTINMSYQVSHQAVAS